MHRACMLTSSRLRELVIRRGPRRRMFLSNSSSGYLAAIELKSNDYAAVTQNPTHTHTATCCSRPHDTPQTEFRVSHHACIPSVLVSLGHLSHLHKKGARVCNERILRQHVASSSRGSSSSSRHCRCELGRLHDAYTRRGMQVPDPVEALRPRACLDGGRP